MAKAEQMLAHRLQPGEPLRPGEHAAAPPRQPGAARARAVPARRRLHGQGRRGRHRRRVHRPPDAGPALERRPAPGGRGQGEGEDRAREPDARDHHLPELLPQVQEALRHDRHRRHRGRGVRQDLQARRHRHPDQPRCCGAIEEPDLVYRTEQEKCDAIVNDIIEKQTEGPAGAGRHGLDREVRAALEAAEAARHQARRPEREVPRAGSRDRRAGRPQGAVTIATNMAGRGTDILLGGNAEFMARQQTLAERDRRAAAQGRGEVRRRRASSSTSSTSTASTACRRPTTSASSSTSRRRPTPSTTRSSRSAACTSSAPSATRRAASTTSCAAAPAARATPARRASTSRSKTT